MKSNQITKSEALQEMLEAQDFSDNLDYTSLGSMAEFLARNIYENNLPTQSSGSFLTAITDYDNFICALNIGEALEELAEENEEEAETLERVIQIELRAEFDRANG